MRQFYKNKIQIKQNKTVFLKKSKLFNNFNETNIIKHTHAYTHSPIYRESKVFESTLITAKINNHLLQTTKSIDRKFSTQVHYYLDYTCKHLSPEHRFTGGREK